MHLLYAFNRLFLIFEIKHSVLYKSSNLDFLVLNSLSLVILATLDSFVC